MSNRGDVLAVLRDNARFTNEDIARQTGLSEAEVEEIVDDLEATPRGVYGGGVGYYSWSGDADFAIVIRTATVDRSGDEDVISVRAGAGIVADSDPAAEYEETEQKMGGVIDALERIEANADGESEAPVEEVSR